MKIRPVGAKLLHNSPFRNFAKASKKCMRSETENLKTK